MKDNIDESNFELQPVADENELKLSEVNNELKKEEKTAIADAFCQIIDRNGHTPMIYGNPKWMRKHIDLSYLSDYDKWLAHYDDKTNYKSEFTMWQYTDSGTVEGIDGPVDMNLYFYEK
jgi:GH25 family lysozyme M1 (1,4-beta-N-acetylmuramidase)